MSPLVVTVQSASAKVSDAQITAAVQALGIQLARDVAPFWGIVPGLAAARKGAKISGCTAIVSDVPDEPGALGYHYVDDAGVPQIKVFAIAGYDWRTTLSHEICELAGNPLVNRWCDGPSGDDYSSELCDPVEGDSYPIGPLGAATVDGPFPASNFILPTYFDPSATSTTRVDFLSKLGAPFSLDAGGYQIVRTEPGAESEITARLVARSGHPRTHVERVPSSHFGGATHVLFGPDYPASRRESKLATLARWRSRRSNHG